MRTLFATLVLLVTVVSYSQAQTYAYANEREYCAYNPRTEKFDKCDSWEDHTVFIIDTRETQFEHITDDTRSIYYIDSKEWDDENNFNIWYVTSANGNKYTCIFNLDNSVAAMLYDDGDDSFIVTFTVSHTWK